MIPKLVADFLQGVSVWNCKTQIFHVPSALQKFTQDKTKTFQSHSDIDSFMMLLLKNANLTMQQFAELYFEGTQFVFLPRIRIYASQGI